jgi:hypothetical protein
MEYLHVFFYSLTALFCYTAGRLYGALKKNNKMFDRCKEEVSRLQALNDYQTYTINALKRDLGITQQNLRNIEKDYDLLKEANQQFQKAV